MTTINLTHWAQIECTTNGQPDKCMLTVTGTRRMPQDSRSCILNTVNIHLHEEDIPVIIKRLSAYLASRQNRIVGIKRRAMEYLEDPS